jgi:hypothetical protein
MKGILEILGESSVRAIIIAFMTACVLRGLRLKSPRVSHRAWTGVLMIMLCLPIISIWIPRITIRVLPAPSIPKAERIQKFAPIIPATRVAVSQMEALQKPTTQSKIMDKGFPQINVYQIAGILDAPSKNRPTQLSNLPRCQPPVLYHALILDEATIERHRVLSTLSAAIHCRWRKGRISSRRSSNECSPASA